MYAKQYEAELDLTFYKRQKLRLQKELIAFDLVHNKFHFGFIIFSLSLLPFPVIFGVSSFRACLIYLIFVLTYAMCILGFIYWSKTSREIITDKIDTVEKKLLKLEEELETKQPIYINNHETLTLTKKSKTIVFR